MTWIFFNHCKIELYPFFSNLSNMHIKALHYTNIQRTSDLRSWYLACRLGERCRNDNPFVWCWQSYALYFDRVFIMETLWTKCPENHIGIITDISYWTNGLINFWPISVTTWDSYAPFYLLHYKYMNPANKISGEVVELSSRMI